VCDDFRRVPSSPVSIEWLRVRDEVVAALAGACHGQPFAASPLYRCATDLLQRSAEDFERIPEHEKEPREKHYLLISHIVDRGQIVGMTRESCMFALWEILDAYLNGRN
jgi:hypothetical protein